MRSLLLALALLVLSAAPAHAILCLPLLGCDCEVSADDISFTYAPLSGDEAEATTDIDVDCNGLSVAPSVTVSLDDGLWGTYDPRNMKGDLTGALLNYNLYTTSGYAIVFGNGTGLTQSVTLNSGQLIGLGDWHASARVYGLIPADQNVEPDTYRDTITVTIVF